MAELGRLNTGNDGGRDTAKRPLLGFQPRYLHLDTGVLPRRSGWGAPPQTKECLLQGCSLCGMWFLPFYYFVDCLVFVLESGIQSFFISECCTACPSALRTTVPRHSCLFLSHKLVETVTQTMVADIVSDKGFWHSPPRIFHRVEHAPLSRIVHLVAWHHHQALQVPSANTYRIFSDSRVRTEQICSQRCLYTADHARLTLLCDRCAPPFASPPALLTRPPHVFRRSRRLAGQE